MTGALPLVSAVIPVYNAEAYLGEAIASVLAQTYAPIECIVVDDGSSDATSDAARRFGEKVRYVRRQRRGVAAARNQGASLARGPVLAFLDADDRWEEHKIERQMALLADRPQLGLIYCSVRRIDQRGADLGTLPAPHPGEALRNMLLLRGPGVSLAQTGLIPVPAFRAAGGFDERLSTAADADLAWRLAARFEIASVPQPLASYRTHPAQMHLDLASYERDVRLLLHKAFTSKLLPPELQRLQRHAHTNLALTLAYMYRAEHRRPLRSLRHMLLALRLAPRRCARAMLIVAQRGFQRRSGA